MSSSAATPAEKTPTWRVVVPLPLSDAYDYLPLAGDPLPAGSVVQVPFGARTLMGVVWGAGAGDVPQDKLRPVLGATTFPFVPDDVRRFVDWVADYTLSPRGAVMKMMFGSMERMQPKKKDIVPDYAFNPDHHLPQLTDDQRRAADSLTAKVAEGGAHVTLLDGVTGSGKTEVFCEAIAACLRQGKQALLLLPEIAMTAALLDRLTARFG
ncbi:MAG: DEAD/DEAH box helicase family protein, partial [Alphaproteobacteria bacterium]|nr:DEAD/DEAH box helicase family protein [Alphaproteobacteria bacterium]